MSSTNKTYYMGLNSWVGADVPKMEDFNADNELLDALISEHFNDDAIHVTLPLLLYHQSRLPRK